VPRRSLDIVAAASPVREIKESDLRSGTSWLVAGRSKGGDGSLISS
jgi:hypothetical protein